MTSWLFFVTTVVVCLVIGAITDDLDYDGSIFRIVGGTCAVFILVVFAICLYETGDKPQAIDVYRGKTELQIKQEIVNNKVVSTDSIVVWRK